MNTKLLRIISILILAAFLLMPGRGTRAAQQPKALQTVPQALVTSAYGITTRISLASDGSQGNGGSEYAAITADGRFVAFDSYASNLVIDDTNNEEDVFVHDRWTGTTERVSITSNGGQADGRSFGRAISADGRFVAFTSYADNLLSGDVNNNGNIFVHDRQTGITELVSVAIDGSQGNGFSHRPSISADGRYVAFHSWASNLVSEDTNGKGDEFVRDRQTGVTKRVSVASDGSQGNGESDGPSISADGRFVAFDSSAWNLVSGDTNNFCDGGSNCWDVFVHDRQTGITERISVASDGTQGNDESVLPSISADGRYVAFVSGASNLVIEDTNGSWDVFIHDRETGETERISVASDGSQGNHTSSEPSISAYGRYVAFHSLASNLVSGDSNDEFDIFVHDRQTGLTERVSVAIDGNQGNEMSITPSISGNGRYIAFYSYASNLVSGDTNGCQDIFVHDREGRNFLRYLPFAKNRP